MKTIYSIVGMRHRGTEALVRSLPNGETIKLVRDHDNPHDTNAVQVWARDQHVGFVKAREAEQLAAQMSFTHMEIMYGRFVAREWPLVEIDE
jgi:hypothetical protein